MKYLLKIIITTTILLSISACGLTPQQQARKAERERMEMRAKVEQIRRAEANRMSNNENQCHSYGFTKGSVPFSQCLMKLDTAQQEAQAKQRQVDAQRSQLQSQCLLVQSQVYAAPTRTGSFWESQNNASAAYNNCMAGLPPPRQINVICSRQGRDQVFCSSQ